MTVIMLLGALIYQRHTLNNAMSLIKAQEQTIDLLNSQTTDTLTRVDTLYQERVVYKPYPQPVEKRITDTIYIPTEQPLFLVSKSFQEELLDGNLKVHLNAQVDGYQRPDNDEYPTLRNLYVKVDVPEVHKTDQITQTQTIIKPHNKRLKPIILPTIGIGYNPFNNKIEPTVGISVGLAKQ